MNSSAAVRLVALREHAIDMNEVLDALEDATAGGLVLFVGRVRDHDHDRGVVALEYSAHPTALAQLNEVCAEVAAEFAVTGLVAVHRVGRLEIGDVAVAVATCSAHRGDSFAASRALIDRLKERVPIWKHQLFTDGGSEWVGTP